MTKKRDPLSMRISRALIEHRERVGEYDSPALDIAEISKRVAADHADIEAVLAAGVRSGWLVMEPHYTVSDAEATRRRIEAHDKAQPGTVEYVLLSWSTFRRERWNAMLDLYEERMAMRNAFVMRDDLLDGLRALPLGSTSMELRVGGHAYSRAEFLRRRFPEHPDAKMTWRKANEMVRDMEKIGVIVTREHPSGKYSIHDQFGDMREIESIDLKRARVEV